MADQQGGNLKPVTPARVAEELRKLSSQRASGGLKADEYEHRFSRMITELRDRRIDGIAGGDPRDADPAAPGGGGHRRGLASPHEAARAGVCLRRWRCPSRRRTAWCSRAR